MKEEWKDIVGYEELYLVSNTGRVKRKERMVEDARGRLRYLPSNELKKSNQRGYVVVQLTNMSKESKAFRVHRLVAQAFIPNLNNLPIVNHINGVKDDNRVDNLEWCTEKHNTIHAHKTGLAKHSKKVAQISLSGEVIKIFNSISDASDSTGVQRTHIGAVCNRRKNFKTSGGVYLEIY